MPSDSYQLNVLDPDSLLLTLSDQGVSIPIPHASRHGSAGDDPITIANTQVTGLGTMSTQAASSVAITGGTISGVTAVGAAGVTDYVGDSVTLGGTATALVVATGTLTVSGVASIAGLTLTTDLSVANGGTGASTLTGIVTGSGTSALTGTTSSTAGQVLLCTGTNTFAFGAVDLADTDAVTGALPVANGGTGATTVAGARTALGFASGHATLVDGTASVTDAAVSASTIVVATHHTTTGPAGHLWVDITNGVGFEINSTNAADDNDVDYILIY